MGGLSINDAMIFGLPVICSVCDGTEKILVREGINGLLFENGNQNDLVKKILSLLENPFVARRMGIRSTEIIRDEINIHTVLKGYLDAFSYVTGKHTAAQRTK
jgi:glycosyltransferase involved in cell wall biosynthesis